MKPQIYVASLSDYVAGRLHGVWIDLEGKDVDDVQVEISEMLKSSHEAPAGEWAIHDTDDFGSISIGEYEPLENIVAMAKLISEHGEAAVAFISDRGSETIDDLESSFENAYVGEFDDLATYAQEMAVECGDMIKNHFQSWPFTCIDWEHAGRELELAGDVWTASCNCGDIHVFRNC